MIEYKTHVVIRPLLNAARALVKKKKKKNLLCHNILVLGLFCFFPLHSLRIHSSAVCIEFFTAGNHFSYRQTRQYWFSCSSAQYRRWWPSISLFCDNLCAQCLRSGFSAVFKNYWTKTRWALRIFFFFNLEVKNVSSSTFYSQAHAYSTIFVTHRTGEAKKENKERKFSKPWACITFRGWTRHNGLIVETCLAFYKTLAVRFKEDGFNFLLET